MLRGKLLPGLTGERRCNNRAFSFSVVINCSYSENYPNSFLDITYPGEDIETPHPTLIYFHGGGFFGGSKSIGDPLAENDATALLDDICSEGFNIMSIDYVFVPEYHFPAPLVQANEALYFLMDHADDYHLDMNRVVIMGSSAGAVITSQLGSVITNPAYAKAIDIVPALKSKQVKAVVIDDAPLVYDQFSLGTYVKGSIFLSHDEIYRYNNVLWIDSNYPSAFLLGSEYYVDMRAMDSALTRMNVGHELADPLAERGLKMQHCFVAAERTDEVSRDAFERMMDFVKEQVQ